MATGTQALYTGRIFPGLRPFEESDAVLFFGREEQTDELLRRLEDTRFLAVVGLSGSGKSSLARAGLLPALRRGHLSGAGPRWRIAVMRPGADPLGAVAEALNQTLGEREERLEMLRSSRLGLLDASRPGRNADENLLIVVDQFEEIFRFQRTGEAVEFVRLLLAAVQEYEPAYRVYVVITMRSDYLGECARFPGLPEALNDSQYLAPRMTTDQLREAIEGPAALGGVEVAPDLLQELLETAGADADQLPVLQHLLMRMWEVRERAKAGSRITRNEYNTAGGWEGALNQHADKIFSNLPEQRKALAIRIFQSLTDKGEASRESRRPTKLRDLAAVAEVPEEEVRAVVEHFRQEGCNFLTSPDRDLTGDSVIDISHESLIRRWKKLADWTKVEADWGEWYRRVEDRRRIGGAYLVDPELESALQAKEKGQWNAAWAERYVTEKGGVQVTYGDVVRFLEESRQVKLRDELGRLRRTRAILGVAAVLFAAVAVAAGYFWWSASRATKEASRQRDDAHEQRKRADLKAREAEKARAEAEGQRKQAEQSAVEAAQQRDLALARRLTYDSESLRNSPLDWTTARLLAAESLRRAETPQGYEALWRTDSRAGRQVARLVHPESVRAVAFSPNGTLAATGSSDNVARVWEVRTGREVTRLVHPDRVIAVAFSPDGMQLATGSWDNNARVWETRTRREVARLEQPDWVNAVAFSPDGILVATGSDDKTARVFEARTRREVARLAHQGFVNAVAFSPDGRLVATGSDDKTARVFEARMGREVARLAHENSVSAVAFSPDGTLVATGSADNTARAFEARTGREVARLAHQAKLVAVAFSPDGMLVATGSADNTARVFEARTGREVARLPLDEPVRYVRFGSGGRFLVTVTGLDDLRVEQHLVRPQDLIAAACSQLDRNLSQEEWKQYLGNVPYRKTCEQLKAAGAVKQ